MPKKKKFIPKKKKTLVPEPNWEKLRKAKTEEQKEAAFRTAHDYVHYEIPEREHLHWLKAWIKKHSGWNLDNNVTEIPDAYMIPFAKYGWMAIMLEFMPQKFYESLANNLKPLLLRSSELKIANQTEGPIHSSVLERDEEDFLHPIKVKKWLEYWVKYLNENKQGIEETSKERKLEYQTAESYVSNMRTYLRTGIWNDSRFGERREGKVLVVCKALAYNSEGIVKRSKGTWYPDTQEVWEGDPIS